MNQITKDQFTLSHFGTAPERVAKAVAAIRAGQGVIVVDDEDRENEGDLIFAARSLTTPQMAQMIRDGSGIVCLVLTDAKCKALELPQMVTENSSQYGTNFTVTIEAKKGVTTGVSAADRVTTILTASAPDAKPSDLARPGHVFPLRAHPQGLAARGGHTEATIELMHRAGVEPCGVLCEVTNPDGTMARLPQLVAYAIEHKMPIVSIEDLLSVGETGGRV